MGQSPRECLAKIIGDYLDARSVDRETPAKADSRCRIMVGDFVAGLVRNLITHNGLSVAARVAACLLKYDGLRPKEDPSPEKNLEAWFKAVEELPADLADLGGRVTLLIDDYWYYPTLADHSAGSDDPFQESRDWARRKSQAKGGDS